MILKGLHTNTNRLYHLWYCEGRAPLLFEDVEANTTITVDIRVENLCAEWNLSNFKTNQQHEKNLAAIVSAILEYSLISYFLKLGGKKPTFHPWFGWIEDWGFLCVEIVRSSCDNDSQNYQQKGGKVTK